MSGHIAAVDGDAAAPAATDRAAGCLGDDRAAVDGDAAALDEAAGFGFRLGEAGGDQHVATVGLFRERAARAVWDLAAMGARPVDAAQERLELAAECRVADTAANLARLLEVAVAHAAVRTDELRHLPALRFRLLRRRAEDTLEEVIHRYIPLSLVLHEEFAVLRRALLTEVLLDLAVRPDLCNMDDRAVAAAILT